MYSSSAVIIALLITLFTTTVVDAQSFPLVRVMGNYVFRINGNPGYLRLQPFASPTSPFGGVCSYFLDPNISSFRTRAQFDRSERVANFFCGHFFNFWRSNGTHVNYFYTETLNTTEVPAPFVAYMRNIECPDVFDCASQLPYYSNDTLMAQEKNFFSKCAFDFFFYDSASAASFAPVSCFANRLVGLHCAAPIGSSPYSPATSTPVASPSPSPSSTSTSTSTSTTSAPWPSATLPKSQQVYTPEGAALGTSWRIRINASNQNRLEVSRNNISNNGPSSWGLACYYSWNNDLARLLCTQFLGFTSKQASFSRLKSNTTTSSLPFAWSSAPQCTGCTVDETLDQCTLFTDDVESCVAGDEIGLTCENISLAAPSNSNSSISPTATSLTVLTVISSSYELKLDQPNGGLVYIRPRNTSYPFGLIGYAAINSDTASSICTWFSKPYGGFARTPADVEANYVQSIPLLGRQPCWLSNVVCYSRSASSLDECYYSTNSASYCGGARNSLYLRCYDQDPNPTSSSTWMGGTTTTTTTTSPGPNSAVGAGSQESRAIGVGLGVGLAALALVVVALFVAWRKREQVLAWLEGIGGAEQHEIDEAEQDKRNEEELREEEKYRHSTDWEVDEVGRQAQLQLKQQQQNDASTTFSPIPSPSPPPSQNEVVSQSILVPIVEVSTGFREKNDEVNNNNNNNSKQDQQNSSAATIVHAESVVETNTQKKSGDRDDDDEFSDREDEPS